MGEEKSPEDFSYKDTQITADDFFPDELIEQVARRSHDLGRLEAQMEQQIQRRAWLDELGGMLIAANVTFGVFAIHQGTPEQKLIGGGAIVLTGIAARSYVYLKRRGLSEMSIGVEKARDRLLSLMPQSDKDTRELASGIILTSEGEIHDPTNVLSGSRTGIRIEDILGEGSDHQSKK